MSDDLGVEDETVARSAGGVPGRRSRGVDGVDDNGGPPGDGGATWGSWSLRESWTKGSSGVRPVICGPD